MLAFDDRGLHALKLPFPLIAVSYSIKDNVRSMTEFDMNRFHLKPVSAFVFATGGFDQKTQKEGGEQSRASLESDIRGQ